MRIFISWSGKRSEHIATALRWWLPNVIQAVDPFISNQDIQKGTRGNVKIAKELEEANVGILCLTPENQDKRWILFEAGALSKLSSAYVCTYLYELDSSDIPPPLGQFQHTKCNEEDTFNLVRTINELTVERKLDRQRLEESFKLWWPKLEEKLNSTPDKPEDEPTPPGRTPDDKLDEILKLVRHIGGSVDTTRVDKQHVLTHDVYILDSLDSNQIATLILTVKKFANEISDVNPSDIRINRKEDRVTFTFEFDSPLGPRARTVFKKHLRQHLSIRGFPSSLRQ